MKIDVKKMKLAKVRKGFIAALDQSGGSTPKALANYGVLENMYSNEDEMFDLVHEMRTRIIKSDSFTKEHILGSILFENTMDRKIDNKYTADYLWDEKEILPFLKIDKGLEDLSKGVQMMKPINNLDELLKKANKRNIFGTKMRSVVKELNEEGIKEIVRQQFDVAKKVLKYGLVPIIEPEIDINMKNKKEAEDLLLKYMLEELNLLEHDDYVIFKLTIPSKANLYKKLMADSRVLRVVALSGGYSREKANDLLSKNEGLIASFSRALLEGLNYKQTKEEFDELLLSSIKEIYKASIT